MIILVDCLLTVNCTSKTSAGLLVAVCACVIVEKPSRPWLFSATLTGQPRSVEVMWFSNFEGRISKFNIYAKPVIEGNCTNGQHLE